MEKMLTLEQLNNVAEIDIVYRSRPGCKMSERPRIVSAMDAVQLLRHYWNKNTLNLLEEFKVLFLNRANRVLQIMQVSKGGICMTVADPRIILAAALKVGACGLIIAHNHPSGNSKPSKADQELTQKIKQAASFLDIRLLDHVIITDEEYYSFADEGLL